MAYEYDRQNVFAKILRGEIPCTKRMETEHSFVFEDIAPKAPVHLLVIPKGPYVCFDHFAEAASDEEISDFVRTVGRAAVEAGVAPGGVGNGYRMISNAGPDGVQEVPHLHVHIIGGRRLGAMTAPGKN
ncbi:MAG: HIT domain-containing protein [Rhodobacteraceae bacterium]|nr:HIT domain-containing protein [Paracoccaceae bacterium]